MNSKEIIALAKQEVADLFAADGVKDVQLEEFQRAGESIWRVTVSFYRPSREGRVGALASHFPGEWGRESKVVEIDDKLGRAISVRNYERKSA